MNHTIESPRRGDSIRMDREQAKPNNIYASNTQLFNGYFMITVKDNAVGDDYDSVDKEFLLYTADKLAEYCLAVMETHEFETGDQERLHIHSICKLEEGQNLPKIEVVSKKLKRYPPTHYEIVTDDNNKEILLKTPIDMSSYTYRITPIESEEHYNNCLTYLKKEKIDFID